MSWTGPRFGIDIGWSLEVITPADSNNVLALGDLKAHLKIDSSDEDQLVEAVRLAALGAVQNDSGRLLQTARLRYRLPCFPGLSRIYLPRPPARQLISLRFTDRDGLVQTVFDSESSPVVDDGSVAIETAHEPGFVFLKPNQSWPNDRLFEGFAVEVVYEAGLPATDDRYHLALQAARVLAGHFYEHRESIVIGSSAQMNAIAAGEVPQGYNWTIEAIRDYSGFG